MLPLCAGWVLVERRAQLPVASGRRLVVGFTVGTAALQLVAWWLEPRRLAVGTNGPLFFLTDAAWDPPGGWWPWVLLMVTSSVAYAAIAVLPGRMGPGERPEPERRPRGVESLGAPPGHADRPVSA